MDQSVGTTIEKIKLQEQDTEVRLKEKREYEAAISSLNRAIKEAMSQCEKSEQEQIEIENRLKKLRPLLEVEKLKRDALLKQLNTFTKMLENLRSQCDQGVTKVWNIRSSLCESVQKISDECDIWALLMRPVLADPMPQAARKYYENNDNIDVNQDRLQAAYQRREKVMAERQNLLAEPEEGEEFVRQVS